MESTQPKILLVEDNPDDAELTGIAIERVDLLEETLWVQDGAEAIAFLKGENSYKPSTYREDLSLILLDLKLPKLNGFEVLEYVRSSEFKYLPVCVLTSSGVNDDIKQALDLGANSYVVKPIDFQKQANNLRSICDFWLNVHQKLEEE
ncbi:MAG: response regulator [Flavobacteriales bacterium]|nr:response regulator [Flavobacteriales bacterium]